MDQRLDEQARVRVRVRRRRKRPWWRSRRLRRRIKRSLPWLLVGLGVIVVATIASLALVWPSVSAAARDGREGLLEGAKAIDRRDAAAATVEFESAQRQFRAAQSRIDSFVSFPLRVLPIASTNMGVARSLTTIGSSVAEAGIVVARTMGELPSQRLALEGGAIDLELVGRAQAALTSAIQTVPEIERAVREMPQGWVARVLADPRRQIDDVVPQVVDGVRKADAALRGLPSVLAAGGKKRYLVAFSNLSELRGAGGLFGYVTALTASDGRLSLDGFAGRPTEVLPSPRDVGFDFPPWFPDDFKKEAALFQNLNMTTDFPTVGSFVLKTAEAGIGPLDGVIALDPIGIAAILRLTGPVSIPGWTEPITADNVAKITMHDVYIAIPNNDKREAFFGALVRTAFGRLVSTTIALGPDEVGAFDVAVRGGHFRMYSKHADDQSLFDTLGMSGAVGRVSDGADVVSVVSANATGNKGDWFLKRDIRYTVALDPDAGTASGDVSVRFRNAAPSSGLPDYVIGSPIAGLPPGLNQQIFTIIRSPSDEFRDLEVGGTHVAPVSAFEGALHAYRAGVDVPSRGRIDVGLRSVAHGVVSRQGDERVYRLRVIPHATAKRDWAQITVAVPKGWTATGRPTFTGELTQDVLLEVHLQRTARASVVRTLLIEPLRAGGRLLERFF